jgi:alpha-glucosidase (family GH31 glycosyl hydrolase)
MLATIDLGQPHWSMDTGGFNGHPSPENYARWMEFASVVPIMRVHGTFGERRQPWVYGPVAEAAAKKAIEWRYSMIPSLYSWEHKAHETGVGIVRPLFWEFPDDPGSANITDEWMLGDGLLVAPVLEEGAKLRTVYLPPGKWINRDTGAEYPGNATFNLALDDPNWQAVPMFVRAGTILASQPVTQYVGEHPVTELTLDIWPDAYRPATFTVYDDDGQTYRYERGDYFSQTVTANVGAITLGVPEGHYRTAIKTYRVRLHLGPGIPVRNLTFPAGKPQP